MIAAGLLIICGLVAGFAFANTSPAWLGFAGVAAVFLGAYIVTRRPQ